MADETPAAEVEDRSHDPFAPQTRPEPAPSFPEDRLRRAGMTDEMIAESKSEWDGWSADEQRQSLEALTALSDDDLAEQVRLAADADADEDEQEKAAEAAKAQAEVDAWALGAVEAGDYANVDEAVAALAALQPAVEGETPDALVGDGSAGGQATVAPGGPGEAVEAPADGDAAAGADPSGTVGVRDEGDARADALTSEAQTRLDRGATVDEMVEWVNDDADRARAVLDLERAGKDRKTLVEALERIVGDEGA